MNGDDFSKYFWRGAAVEIASRDQGFEGSWFEGIVLCPPRSAKRGPDKVLVEYKTLTADEAGKQRLREELQVVQLRPLPPREVRRTFKIGENVDAYYNEGWWEGTITEVAGDGKYRVFFRGTRDRKVFGPTKLRVHREWDYGKWVPPFDSSTELMPVLIDSSTEVKPDSFDSSTEVKPDSFDSSTEVMSDPFDSSTEVMSDPFDSSTEVMSDPFDSSTEVMPDLPVDYEKYSADVEAKNEDEPEHTYTPGDSVEVSNNEVGFEGAWFPATILKGLKKGKYLIEYETLKDDDDSTLLREEVGSHFLRPCPPELEMIDRFVVGEEVDASCNAGWWVGVISKVHKIESYSVYFSASEEELKFKHTDLRVHQDWLNGKWETSKPRY